MQARSDFARKLSQLALTHAERAVAFLWYYRSTQQYDERTARDLAEDMHEEGFPLANPTRLESDLQKGRWVTRGKRKGALQIDIRKLDSLNEKYAPLVSAKAVQATDSVVPKAWVAGTRRYLEQIVDEINGSYDLGYWDACAAMQRRLMESLVLEVYVGSGRHTEVQVGGVFYPLEKLIAHIRSDKSVVLGRNTPKTMELVKELGDTAAHDRTYLTLQLDIDDIKLKFRKMIRELLDLTIGKP
jgi:hypothetical protein